MHKGRGHEIDHLMISSKDKLRNTNLENLEQQNIVQGQDQQTCGQQWSSPGDATHKPFMRCRIGALWQPHSYSLNDEPNEESRNALRCSRRYEATALHVDNVHGWQRIQAIFEGRKVP